MVSASAATRRSLSAFSGWSDAHGLLERSREPRVDLDGRDVLDDRQQREGERAEARSDLDDDVVRAHPGDADDLAHRVGVDDEVLAPLLGRSHLEPLGELAHLGRPEERGVVDVRRVLLRHAHTLWPRPKEQSVRGADGLLFRSGLRQVRACTATARRRCRRRGGSRR